jgi:hypothetical protein
MNPSRILPDLQCSLICEEVRQEINGNFILVGVLGFVRVPQVPITAHKLCVFNRWTSGVGQFTEVVRLVAPDQTTVLRTGQTKFALQDAAHHATNLTLLGQVQFPTAGIYYIEVLVEEVMKIRFPFPVVLAPPTQKQGGPSPRAGSPPPETPPPPATPEAAP